MDRIKTYLVYGFLDAGKTTYIQEQIFGGYFHKHGSTLILSFEDGEREYDVEKFRSYRTDIALYEGGCDIPSFCSAAIDSFRPDRVYVEMNAMREDLRNQLPDMLDVIFNVTLIDGTTLPLYFNNMRQMMQNMIADSQMVIFNRCEDKGLLANYSVPFRLMNRRCEFLRQSKMGYSEKAFGRLLPYDMASPALHIPEADYPVFHLDCQENPQNYDGKTVSFDAQVKTREDIADGFLWLGRSVMTCCIMDIQFLGFECSVSEDVQAELSEGQWVHIEADACLAPDRYRAQILRLNIRRAEPVTPPAQSIIGLK